MNRKIKENIFPLMEWFTSTFLSYIKKSVFLFCKSIETFCLLPHYKTSRKKTRQLLNGLGSLWSKKTGLTRTWVHLSPFLFTLEKDIEAIRC